MTMHLCSLGGVIGQVNATDRDGKDNAITYAIVNGSSNYSIDALGRIILEEMFPFVNTSEVCPPIATCACICRHFTSSSLHVQCVTKWQCVIAFKDIS